MSLPGLSSKKSVLEQIASGVKRSATEMASMDKWAMSNAPAVAGKVRRVQAVLGMVFLEVKELYRLLEAVDKKDSDEKEPKQEEGGGEIEKPA